MNKKLVLLGTALLVGATTVSAQKRVTGRVVDSDGVPVFGATVKVEGTKFVTVTDEKGNFSLNGVPASAKQLVVSFIGMKSATVSVAGNVNVVLKQNDRVLDEAVVVGYGTARKVGTVVGSVTKISGESIADKPTANIADAMQGQVAGLQILNNSGDAGAINSSTINIRGIGSLSASNTPLIVIDGSPVGVSMLNMLNPQDIESITTLKDASATSIYGSRAANGVIYVTTKRGRLGDKSEVIISQKLGWSQLARSIGNPMNAAELLDFQLENGIITGAQYAEYKAHGSNINWQKYHFRNDAPMYETNFSVRGGSESTRYFLSGSYMKNTGTDDASHMKRYTMRSNIESKVFDWMTVGVNQNIVYTDRLSNGYTVAGTNNMRSYSTAAMTFCPYWDPYDPASRETHSILYMGSYDTKWLNDLQPAKINDILYSATGFIQLNPIKGLTIKSQLGAYATNTKIAQSVLTEFPGNNGIASTSRQDTRGAQWTITNTAEYRFNIGEDHEITLLAGQEGIRSTTEGFTASAKGSTDNRLLLLSNMTEANLPTETTTASQFLSFFGRADYSLMSRYFANFTVRNDQSSRFGRTNRSALFFSGGAMWNMKMENWLRGVEWLDELDVRLSVGTTGNAGIGDYEHLGLIGTTQYGGVQGWGLSQPSNTELGWEQQIQTNVGFNATLFHRLNLEFNWYNRKTKDMLMGVPLPYTTGFTTQALNIGQMSNRGVEVTANYNVFRNKDLSIDIRANYAYNTNTIDELFYGIEEWPMEDYLLCYKVGSSLNYYMPIYAGVDKEDGAPMWYKPGFKGDAVHEFNPETMTKDASNMSALNQDTGKPYYAPHTGGFGLQVTWKGLTLSTDFAFVLGKYMVDNTYLWNTSKSSTDQGYNCDRDLLNIWKKPGDLAYLPAYQYEGQFDTHLLQNASFLRLKNLTLAYDLPSEIIGRSGFVKGVRLSFTTRNLFTVTKYKGADPEISTNIAYGNYPATREYVMGLEVRF